MLLKHIWYFLLSFCNFKANFYQRLNHYQRLIHRTIFRRGYSQRKRNLKNLYSSSGGLHNYSNLVKLKYNEKTIDMFSMNFPSKKLLWIMRILEFYWFFVYVFANIHDFQKKGRLLIHDFLVSFALVVMVSAWWSRVFEIKKYFNVLAS